MQTDRGGVRDLLSGLAHAVRDVDARSVGVRRLAQRLDEPAEERASGHRPPRRQLVGGRRDAGRAEPLAGPARRTAAGRGGTTGSPA